MPSALFFVSDYYELRYQADRGILHGRARRGLSMDEFLEVCEQFLLLARQQHCRYWLLDGRADINRRDPSIYLWLNEDYLPRVREALGEGPCMAFLATPEQWAQLGQRGYGPNAPARPASLSYTGWFTEEAQALSWLNKFRSPLPAA
ncbi:hypothetical protein GCM10023185_44630 [Hymenobacter saemangeumensis]|uniref:STAS/SEC14 domain-containing protein n=1 Tax=Hymenobacter saemangeumensis TaxID=1084522 RepID=A0ABP8ISB0_9BACT